MNALSRDRSLGQRYGRVLIARSCRVQRGSLIRPREEVLETGPLCVQIEQQVPGSDPALHKPTSGRRGTRRSWAPGPLAAARRNLYLHGGSRFNACKPDPGPALVDGAVGFEYLYIDKSFTERFPYLFRRECRCPYDFCKQFMSAVPVEL